MVGLLPVPHPIGRYTERGDLVSRCCLIREGNQMQRLTTHVYTFTDHYLILTLQPDSSLQLLFLDISFDSRCTVFVVGMLSYSTFGVICLISYIPLYNRMSVIRKYQANAFTALWFTAYLWGVIFTHNQVRETNGYITCQCLRRRG